MKTALISSFVILTIFFSCNTSGKKRREEKTISHLDNAVLKQDNSDTTNKHEGNSKKASHEIKPVFGYRFIISGDFNGDGKEDNLIEHFVSGLDNKETNKFYDGLSDYDELVELTIKKEPVSFVSSDNNQIDTLKISSGGQLLGLSYLKNEGDLNGDGTDEISYVVNWADWSNLNTWNLMSYKHDKWTELYSFPIWDWQLPDLPQNFNQFGLFGLEQKIINTSNDSINEHIENKLLDFKGLVKKIETNKIQVIFRNEEAMQDTAIIELKD